ncbi:hypothetical protein GCM10023065_30700 [Microbacterium laevaniformans]|uniref:hypothetical protein n=1 Tax=Microbacterium laevaniformans TaxID=36807 RepID=UPI0031E845A7
MVTDGGETFGEHAAQAVAELFESGVRDLQPTVGDRELDRGIPLTDEGLPRLIAEDLGDLLTLRAPK